MQEVVANVAVDVTIRLGLTLLVQNLGCAIKPVDESYQNQLKPPLKSMIYSARCAIPFYVKQLVFFLK